MKNYCHTCFQDEFLIQMSGFEVIKLGHPTKQVLNISDELDKPIIKAIRLSVHNSAKIASKS